MSVPAALPDNPLPVHCIAVRDYDFELLAYRAAGWRGWGRRP